ncbi:MAG: hypothetical protein KKE86_13750 [Planctomycetes bacterium]|nr:hypothetical protein [Planctomycetota bacterium]MBU4400385.1 hypothetical protein [Planctomycetota bacterium]
MATDFQRKVKRLETQLQGVESRIHARAKRLDALAAGGVAAESGRDFARRITRHNPALGGWGVDCSVTGRQIPLTEEQEATRLRESRAAVEALPARVFYEKITTPETRGAQL